jgi:hypothetical protein
MGRLEYLSQQCRPHRGLDTHQILERQIVCILLATPCISPMSISSICDVGCWNLLCNIVTQPMPLEPAKDNRALKTWILPVLSRNPIYPIVINCLDLFTAQSFELTAIVHNTLLILWPLSVKKFNTENLLEVFVAVLRAVTRCETDGKLDRSLEGLGVILTSSFRTSALSSTNKKVCHSLLCVCDSNSQLTCSSTTLSCCPISRHG